MTTTHAPGGAPEGTRERTKYAVTIDLWAHEDTGIASATVGVRNHQGGRSLERRPLTDHASLGDAFDDAVSDRRPRVGHQRGLPSLVEDQTGRRSPLRPPPPRRPRLRLRAEPPLPLRLVDARLRVRRPAWHVVDARAPPAHVPLDSTLAAACRNRCLEALATAPVRRDDELAAPHAPAPRLRGRRLRDVIRRVLPVRYRPPLRDHPRIQVDTADAARLLLLPRFDAVEPDALTSNLDRVAVGRASPPSATLRMTASSSTRSPTNSMHADSKPGPTRARHATGWARTSGEAEALLSDMCGRSGRDAEWEMRADTPRPGAVPINSEEPKP